MMVDTTLGLPQSLWPLRSPKWLSGPVSFPLKRLARALPILCGSCEMVARGQVYYHFYHYCCSSQPSLVHWLSSSIFPCLVVCSFVCLFVVPLW